MQPPTPSPQPLPINLQENNNKENKHANRSLDPKALRRSTSLRPLNLLITNHKASQHSRLIQPGAHLTATLRITIEIVARDSNGRDHDAEDVEAPGEGCDHVMVAVLETEAEEREAADHEGS